MQVWFYEKVKKRWQGKNYMLLWIYGNAKKGGGKMFDEEKFRQVIKEKNVTLQEIADMLDINLVTLYRKMSGESDFYRNEIETIKNNLNIDNALEIFFANKIA